MSDTGPFLKAALLCEQVIEGKDGVLTLVRVIDRLTVTAAGTGAAGVPAEMPVTSHQMWLVLMFVSGRALGSEEIEVVMERPDGRDSIFSSTAYFEGEDKGANIIVRLQPEFKSEGLYWFNIILEKEQISRVPFRVIYQRIARGKPPL